MILHTVDTPIESSGKLEISQFKIATSAKAFKILSSNLYSNKIRAVIRELSCNAYDSHKAAGVADKPFDITMPNVFNEQFIVRDYGVGLSHDDVMELYTTYFASTKSESNDYVGALGLGSKSPFAYSDTFGVTSYFNGVARTYAVFIKDGEPSITLVNEQQTSEHNGLEVAVPVDSRDVNQFKVEATYVFSCFDTQPNFTGSSVHISTPSKASVKSETDEWFYGTWSPYVSSEVYAIMGGVIYPIKNTYFDPYLKTQHEILGRALFIKFDLGDLDITPSREELSYDDVTVARIKAKMQKIVDEICTGFSKAVAGMSIRQKIYTLRKMDRGLNSLEIEDLLDKTIKEDVSSWHDSLYIPALAQYPFIKQVKQQDGSVVATTEFKNTPIPVRFYTKTTYRSSSITKKVNTDNKYYADPKKTRLYLVKDDLDKGTGITVGIQEFFDTHDTTGLIVYVETDVHQKTFIDKIKATFEANEIIELNLTALIASFRAKNPVVKKAVNKATSIDVYNEISSKWDRFDSWKHFIETATGFVTSTNRTSLHSVVGDQLLTSDYGGKSEYLKLLLSSGCIPDDSSLYIVGREFRERIETAIRNNKTRLVCVHSHMKNLCERVSSDPILLHQFKTLCLIKLTNFDSIINTIERRFSYLYEISASDLSEFKQCVIERLHVKSDVVVDTAVEQLYHYISEYTSNNGRMYIELAMIQDMFRIESKAVEQKITDIRTRFITTYPLVWIAIQQSLPSGVPTHYILRDMINYMENIDNGYSI